MKFPSQLQDRLAKTVADTRRAVTTAHQRLNTIGSAVSALQPGDWETVTLTAGWSNLAGFIPAQAQFQRTGMVLLVGHITGGATTSGTIIGQLTAGYFNPVHAHAFTANVIAGAAAVAVTGTVAGASDNSGIANTKITGNSNWAGLPDGTLAGSSQYGTGGSTTTTHWHDGGTFAVSNGQHYHAGSAGTGNLQVTDASHTHGATGLTPSVPINYNNATITVNTAGQIILTNAPSAATQISFNEHLPLVTA